MMDNLVDGAITILKNDGVRQWEGWHPIYEMENKIHSKPPTSIDYYVINSMEFGKLDICRYGEASRF